jgi:hypothetical protein
MIAITVPFLEKFACVVAGKIIGISRHPDYFEYHARLRDLKKICIEGLTKFIRVDGQGQVESIVLAENLLTKGSKIEPQPVESLTDEEKAEIAAAFELVIQPMQTETDAEAAAADSQEAAAPTAPATTTSPAHKASKNKSRIRPNRQRSTPAAR